MAAPAAVSPAAQAALNAALDAVPECTALIGGYCAEMPPSNKGAVLYYSFDACAESFINLPGINLLPTWLLAVMWALFLMWLFAGVAVVSVITTATKKVKRKDKLGNEVVCDVPVWNWAVANITLLALGSSSPEILLALVDVILALDKPAGDIGPSTIIGSAAYNLFMILAVCIIALPKGVFKKVEHVQVFWWTTAWSMWAQIWLWLVYTWISPNVIDLWEALVTTAFMPVFVYTTYLVDTRGFNWLRRRSNVIAPEGDVEGADGHNTNHVTAPQQAEVYHLPYHKQAMKGGVKALQLPMSMSGYDLLSIKERHLRQANLDGRIPKVLLLNADVSVLESEHEARIQVERLFGDMNETLQVNYTCKDGTAVQGIDYEFKEGTLVFHPGSTSQDIVIKVIGDEMFIPDIVFQVLLTSATTSEGGKVEILRKQADVSIVDKEGERTMLFELPSYEVGAADDFAEVVVIRRGGASRTDTVRYFTKDATAIKYSQYKPASGELVFNKWETCKVIRVPILPFKADKDLSLGVLAFRVELHDPSRGCILGARKECRVRIVPGSRMSATKALHPDLKDDRTDKGYDLFGVWWKNIKGAVVPDYGPDDGAQWQTVLLHYLTVTWKLFTSLLPPAEWKGGYPCLAGALCMLGGLMVLVKEVAEMFGCAVGLSALMTGISIVSIGTSLPDTFGSRYAAIHDSTADAAIGNIMASNAVNVFLGLGIPWLVATIYYVTQGTIYDVLAGGLSFSILVYFVLMAVCLALILIRRRMGGELGGPKFGQFVSVILLTALWLTFLILSGLYNYGWIPELPF